MEDQETKKILLNDRYNNNNMNRNLDFLRNKIAY